ncbi:thiol-disulfide oxidoreductase DCC family protein [Rhizobium miluonense]|uniref:DCC family thiol-disulfide oxidoreductase YuxK n=1 Tax=Rhizobium miluonense TaxID=411945 RepID=A0ABU1SUW2_9HYPH|nr:thiol-disulfide oxidoreductase DCC family protein [Rhizobium miluonense]MDR6902745.1 putative DCC family thiol-disulfide oxidoreductase YuxK [Rhizobium miluonense]
MNKSTISDHHGPIIVFDAMCVLCTANAQFVLRHDHLGRFRLASMQNETGIALYRFCGMDPADPDSLIIVDGAKVLRNSDAVLAIYAGLGWPWKAISVLRIIPRMLRDPIYLWLARNRYRIFGKRETCWLPTPEQASRIL